MITDPKVLAMIRAHSLPPSGNQQQPPGERFNQAAEYVSQQPTMGRVSQAVSYPSPSQSPNMPGATSNSVRIDRGTKPAMYSENQTDLALADLVEAEIVMKVLA
jgi:hypothetical protein